MKKILSVLLILVCVVALVSCTDTDKDENKDDDVVTGNNNDKQDDAVVDGDDKKDDVKVMTFEEYSKLPANEEAEVTVETYVQAHQSWWDNKITVYAQSRDGAYLLYELACSEEDAQKLVPGTKIRVTGYKAEWGGEVEISDGTFEFVNDGDTYIAQAFDATSLLGTPELEAHMNEFVSFNGMTFKSLEYKNGEPGDDIYVTLTKDGADYSFCVEFYLTGTDSDVYKTVGTLKEGDIVNIEAFLYWYNGANPHITSVTVAE